MKIFLVIILVIGGIVGWKQYEHAQAKARSTQARLDALQTDARGSKSRLEGEAKKEAAKRREAESAVSDLTARQAAAQQEISYQARLANRPTTLPTDLKKYAGEVNGLPATIALRWLSPDSVVGLLVRNGDEFTLAGEANENQQLHFAVAWRGRAVAELKVSKAGGGWSGALRMDEDGTIMPVALRPLVQEGKSLTVENRTPDGIEFIIGYFDEEQKVWMTQGFWKIAPSHRTSIQVPTASDYFFYRAQAGTKLTWEGEQHLSVGVHDAFTIRGADSRFPTFTGDAAKLNFAESAAMDRAAFRKASFAEGDGGTLLPLTVK